MVDRGIKSITMTNHQGRSLKRWFYDQLRLRVVRNTEYENVTGALSQSGKSRISFAVDFCGES